MKLIDKDKVVAEIKKRIKGLKDCHADTVAGYAGEISGLERLLSFLDTIEVKEINNVWRNAKRTIPEDGKEQIICIKEDGLAVSTVGKIVNGTIKWAYLNDLLDTSSFNIETKRE